jgi:LPS export ABC transporter protein LptC
LAVLSLSISCAQTEKPGGQVQEMKIPDSILEKATIIMTSAGLRRAVIVADTLYVFEKEDSTSARRVKVDFYNDKGQYQSTLTADRGLVRQKQEAFSAWGNVVVKNDSARLESQSLNWDTKRSLITTDDFVRFERRNDIIMGYGLEADSKLENVRILRNVQGRMSNLPSTEKELDSIEGDKSGGQAP